MLFLTRGRWRTAATAMTAGALAATTLAFAGAPAQAAEGASVTASTALNGQTVEVAVEGSNFDLAWRQIPPIAGAYAAVAEKQDITSVPTSEVMGIFVDTDFVTLERFTSGSFASVLELPVAELSEDADYAVYTWTAHGYPAASDVNLTETDIQIPAEAFEDGSAEDVQPTVAASAAVIGDYVDVTVSGANFDPASRPGAMGVYAALAPKQNIFAVDAEGEEDGVAAFLTSDWVTPARFTDGAWNSTLTVDKSELVKGVEYAVYTWTAHGNPTAGDSQYTETIVSIPGLPKNATKTTVKVKKKPTTKKKGKAKVTVKGVDGVKVTGKVKVTLKKGKQTKKVNGKLNKKGKVTVKLPKLKKGKWKIVAKYTADKNYKKSKQAKKFKVKK